MSESNREVATLGGGCFWCLEAVFEQLNGVESVVSGYSGGFVTNPTYDDVCTKKTGHAEVVQVTFDPSVISFADLLGVFFAVHDPTTPNRQGNDVGPQYRSAIFYHSEEQRAAANEVIADLSAAEIWPTAVVTELSPFKEFFPAEDYHQGYFRANPAQQYCALIVAPKVAKFRSQFRGLLKQPGSVINEPWHAQPD